MDLKAVKLTRQHKYLTKVIIVLYHSSSHIELVSVSSTIVCVLLLNNKGVCSRYVPGHCDIYHDSHKYSLVLILDVEA